MRKCAFFALAAGASLAVSAETAYVTDSLRLGLHLAPDTSDRPFENLVSGTAVEILERNSSYARVRLGDGREGWAKATFLVTVKPAAARVIELEADIDNLENAVTTAKAAELTAQQELARLTGDVQSTTGSAESIEETVRRLQAENRVHEERLEAFRGTLPLIWVVPALVVALVAGFLAGLWWLDSLIRRRHGGFRVY